jgi:hypothetical protein
LGQLRKKNRSKQTNIGKIDPVTGEPVLKPEFIAKLLNNPELITKLKKKFPNEIFDFESQKVILLKS